MFMTVLLWVLTNGPATADVLLPKSHYASAAVHDEPNPERYFWFKDPIVAPKPGLLLASGFERGFVIAGAAARVNGLLILDKNPEVVSQVRTNAQLLATLPFPYYSMVRNRRDVHVDSFALEMTIEQEDMRSFFSATDRLHMQFKRLDPSVNYWINEPRYQRLAQMARARRIVAQPVPFFTAGEPMRAVVEELKQHGEKVSVLLLGTSVMELLRERGRKEGIRAFRAFLHVLEPVLNDDAIAFYVHPVFGAAQPYYERVKISDLLGAGDHLLANFFTSDCEIYLTQTRRRVASR